MTHIRMILKHLCLSGMLGIIQSKITFFLGYILLPLLCSFYGDNFSRFDVKTIIFSQFWPGTFFPKIARKTRVLIEKVQTNRDFPTFLK